MADAKMVRLNQRGVLTLPSSIRRAYDLNPGDTLSIVDLGDALVLTPARLEVDRIADRLEARLSECGESLGSMLDALGEERESGET